MAKTEERRSNPILNRSWFNNLRKGHTPLGRVGLTDKEAMEIVDLFYWFWKLGFTNAEISWVAGLHTSESAQKAVRLIEKSKGNGSGYLLDGLRRAHNKAVDLMAQMELDYKNSVHTFKLRKVLVQWAMPMPGAGDEVKSGPDSVETSPKRPAGSTLLVPGMEAKTLEEEYDEVWQYACTALERLDHYLARIPKELSHLRAEQFRKELDEVLTRAMPA